MQAFAVGRPRSSSGLCLRSPAAARTRCAAVAAPPSQQAVVGSGLRILPCVPGHFAQVARLRAEAYYEVRVGFPFNHCSTFLLATRHT
jgi:hypothetical protein